VETIFRLAEPRLCQSLERGRSVLLLGPRQTGKTTLIERLEPDLSLNLMRPEIRQRYERAPELMNVVQDLIDRRLARFVLTGSSARKLRRGTGINLLPGRLTPLRLDPLSIAERCPPKLEDALV